MKDKLKNSIFISTLILLIFGINTVNAQSVSNVVIKFDEGNDVVNSYEDAMVYISMENSSDNEYRVLITKDTTSIPNTIDDPETRGLIFLSKDVSVDNYDNTYIYGESYFEYASKYGDVYFTLYEYDGTTFSKASDSVLFKRPSYQPLTNRIVAQFYDDNSLGVKIRDIYNENSTINFKIGEVTDANLLNKLVDGSNSSYEELLTYAKNDTNPNQTNKIKINNRDGMSDDTLGDYNNLYDYSKIKKDTYYYGYFEIDSENGTYATLEDIALYKLEDGILIHTNYRSDVNINDTTTPEVDETQKEDVSQDDVVENPKTGNAIPYVAVIGLLVVGVICFISAKKCNYFTKI